VSVLQGGYPFLTMEWALRLVRAYGTDAPKMLGDATSLDDLGFHFGWNLYEREVQWLMDREWARTADDVLYRRSKIGLRVSKDEAAALDAWMVAARSEAVHAAE
jgi:glycerol-3-phosphate dehydrogenase